MSEADVRAVLEAAAKVCEKRAQALADSYCHTEYDTGAHVWTNREAEWGAIEMDEVAEQLRALSPATIPGLALSDEECVSVPIRLMQLVRKVWLPTNPNKIRSAAPETIQSAREFIALADRLPAPPHPTKP